MSEEVAAAETPNNIVEPTNTSIDGSVPTQEVTPFDIKSIIPEQYKDAPYLQDIDSADKLFDKFAGAQKLIGQKALPDQNSSVEQWNEFYSNMGRPESADQYEFSKPAEGMPTDETFTNAAKEAMHNAGLSQKQASVLQEWFDGQSADAFKQSQSNVAEQDKMFDELADKTFGDKKEAIFKNAKDLIDKNLPESMREQFDKLPNESLVLLAGVLNNVSNKYMGEDKLSNGTASSGNVDPEAQTQERVQFMTKNNTALWDPFHPEYKNLQKRFSELGGTSTLYPK